MNRSCQRTAISSGGHSAPGLDCFGLTDRGRVRAENEDAFGMHPRQGLFIVSDGMGGQNAGGLASQMVVAVLPSLIQENLSGIDGLNFTTARNRLGTILSKLSADMRSRSEGVTGLDGMGATLVLALVRGDRMLIAHVGDSRAYRYRNWHLELLTKDHTVAQELFEHGEITRSEARNHPEKHVLTRSIGMPGESLADVRCFELRPGDQTLLCSDGLTNMVSATSICEVMKSGLPSCEICKRLVTAANNAGGVDNITAVHFGCLAARRTLDLRPSPIEERERARANRFSRAV